MADFGVVLDAASVAGLSGGKKGIKAVGTQAGFVAAFIAQMGKVGTAKSGGPPEDLVSAATLPTLTSRTEVSIDPADPLFLDVKPDEAGEAVEQPCANCDQGTATLAHPAGVVPVSPPGMTTGSDDAPMAGTGSSELEGSDEMSAPRRNMLSDTVSALEGRRSRNAAIVAGKDGNNALVSPVIGTGASPAMNAVATTTDVVGEGAEIAALPLSPKSEVAIDTNIPRGFDQVLRQVETRLNASVEAPVRSHAFAEELGDKLVWLVNRNSQVAELSLNPPQLGSVEVRLTLSGGEAGVQFFAANSQAREAIESALPRLRELMAQAGINLGEAQVRDQALSQERKGNLPTDGMVGIASEEAASITHAQAVTRLTGIGMVDLYV